MASALLSATHLAAARGERLLFREVSLSLAPGEALVLRGANGAGKTTLQPHQARLTRPEAGEVHRDGAHHWIAHRTGLKPHETPRQHLQLWARAWGSDEADVDEVLAAMGLARPADLPARLLSAGQRQRTALARLKLQHRPVWLMDEPFSALDVDARKRLENEIEVHCSGGGAVIAAVHGEPGFAVSGEVVL
ncbi:MAG: heme ABC exporter ATP-binding protein CcmA [Hyphomonadaceae bacterium]|nr:heme ABC exporter ATP-binding protein CcmA [Hyphomonadaceae bacterium]